MTDIIKPFDVIFRARRHQLMSITKGADIDVCNKGGQRQLMSITEGVDVNCRLLQKGPTSNLI